MRLTVFSDYALRVLLVLASRTDALVTIADIARAFDISHAHLMKVTHVLGKTAWVETVRGRNGGMRLAVDPRKLKLGQIVQALEEDFALVECFGPKHPLRADRRLRVGSGARAGDAELLSRTRPLLSGGSGRHEPGAAALPMWQPVTWASPGGVPAGSGRRSPTARAT